MFHLASIITIILCMVPCYPAFRHQASYRSSSHLFAESPTETFCRHVDDSLAEGSFAGFTLLGPRTGNDKVALRGRLKRVQGRPLELKKINRRAVQVTYKFHGATDVAKNYEQDQVVETVIRPLLEGQSVLDSEWGPAVEAAIGTTADSSLQGARLDLTNAKTWEYQAAFGGKHRLVSQKSKVKQQSTESLAHDRVKQRPLSLTDMVWPALGLVTADGRPKPGKKAKLTQAQKFVEVVSRLIDQVASSGQNLQIYDMGCGRAYLSFALHAYLMQNASDRHVNTLGVDVRPKLVSDMNELSKSLDFHGLSFYQGTIEEYMLDDSAEVGTKDGDDTVKVWLALHACDTATDDALWSGIVQNANIIVVAPCCHKELRPQLDQSVPEPDVLRHGIFRQRWAATLTDSIRVLLLEMVGYQVQVLEFVQAADTPQNVMITAVRKRRTVNRSRSDSVRKKLQDLAQKYGVTHQALATWMGESLQKSKDNQILSRTQGMPPL